MSTLSVGNVPVTLGQRKRIELPVGRLYTQTPMTLPVEVINGQHPGPRLWLSAALHGDELNGVEIIHRVLEKISPKRLRGELIAVPIVNVFGFIQQRRYLPDRRDLNRSFPGSRSGSLAARLAHLFMAEIVGKCTHGIDLHTASLHRTNLPQVRCDMDDPETRRCAEAFAPPIIMNSAGPRGSLRQACVRRKIPILLYEAGEPLRFNREAIDAGVKGILRVMGELGMIKSPKTRSRQSIRAEHSTWVRARRGGILRLSTKLGHSVEKGQTLGIIHDAFGQEKSLVRSPAAGLVIGHTNNPLVNQGDAILHLAKAVARQAR